MVKGALQLKTLRRGVYRGGSNVITRLLKQKEKGGRKVRQRGPSIEAEEGRVRNRGTKAASRSWERPGHSLPESTQEEPPLPLP